MKFAAIAAAGLLALGTPAMAQEAPSQPHPIASADAPVDAERVALAKEMAGLFDMKSMLHGAYASMAASMKPPASATPEQRAKVRQLLASIGVGFDAAEPEMMDKIIDLYARNFTAQEMRDTLVFYRSQSGQAILKKLPVLMNQVMPLTFSLLPKVYAVAEADYCSHQTCDKTDHEIFEKMKAAYAAKPAS